MDEYDRITQILNSRSGYSYNPEPIGLPDNLIEATGFGAIANGGNPVSAIMNVANQRQQQERQGAMDVLSIFERKKAAGDHQAKALDDKINLFTGGDPEGNALFLQALHDDPEPIDPSNSYQVMTKLAGIKKQTGYESPKLALAQRKAEADIAAQEGLAEYRSNRNSGGGGGGGGNSPAGKILPSTPAKAILENRENYDKAAKALALISGNTIAMNNGQIIKGDKNATGMKGFLPDKILQRTDSAGVSTRAIIADLGSLVIHDRSGAAVTASEYPRLAPFIPTVTDDPAVAKKKLERFVAEYQTLMQENEDFYRESGYRVPDYKERFTVTDDPRIQEALDEGYTREEIEAHLNKSK